MVFRRSKAEGAGDTPEGNTNTTEYARRRTEVGAVAIGSTVEIPSGEKPKRLKPTGIDATGSDSPMGFSVTGGW